MSKVSLRDRFSATLLTVTSAFSDPDELRITPLRYRQVSGAESAAVPWVELKPKLVPGWMSQVGVVTLDKEKVFAAMWELPDAKLGIARAVGKTAVVFAELPGHVLIDLTEPPSRKHSGNTFELGIQVGRNEESVRVAPALLMPNRSLHVVPGAVADQHLTYLEHVPEDVRVF